MICVSGPIVDFLYQEHPAIDGVTSATGSDPDIAIPTSILHPPIEASEISTYSELADVFTPRHASNFYTQASLLTSQSSVDSTLLQPLHMMPYDPNIHFSTFSALCTALDDFSQ